MLEQRGDLLFPREPYLSEALDMLTQVANWGEVLGFIKRHSYATSVTDAYVFGQRAATEKARREGSATPRRDREDSK